MRQAVFCKHMQQKKSPNLTCPKHLRATNSVTVLLNERNISPLFYKTILLDITAVMTSLQFLDSF